MLFAFVFSFQAVAKTRLDWRLAELERRKRERREEIRWERERDRREAEKFLREVKKSHRDRELEEAKRRKKQRELEKRELKKAEKIWEILGRKLWGKDYKKYKVK